MAKHGGDNVSDPPDWAEMLAVFRQCMDKYQKGEKKYGAFNPKTDDRDMLEEAKQELIDSINYFAMKIRQIEEWQREWEPPHQNG